jgi:predicted dehydrogenase
MDHFSDCVLNNKTPKTPGEEGLRDVRIMMAIYDSARTGKTVRV